MRSPLIYFIALAVAISACSHDTADATEPESPEIVEPGDQEGALSAELADATLRATSSEGFSLRIDNPGTLAAVEADGSLRYIDLETSRILTFAYDAVNNADGILSGSKLEVMGRSIAVRKARLERATESTRWISVETDNGATYMIVHEAPDGE